MLLSEGANLWALAELMTNERHAMHGSGHDETLDVAWSLSTCHRAHLAGPAGTPSGHLPVSEGHQLPHYTHHSAALVRPRPAQPPSILGDGHAPAPPLPSFMLGPLPLWLSAQGPVNVASSEHPQRLAIPGLNCRPALWQECVHQGPRRAVGMWGHCRRGLGFSRGHLAGAGLGLSGAPGALHRLHK